jgi:hypothetical protein
MQIEIGTVYKKYRCGHVVPKSVPIVRAYHATAKTESGNRVTVTCCPICKTIEAGYDYTFKICPECLEIRWAKRGRLREGRCKVCSREAYVKSYVKRTTPKKKPRRAIYFQDGERIEKPRRVISKLDCTHRTQCLPFQPGGVLHCGGCKRYERIERDWTGCTRHDDTIWALGA